MTLSKKLEAVLDQLSTRPYADEDDFVPEFLR